MANDLLRGRQVVVPLTNKSGGDVVEGDVVILSSGTAAAFTTTTTAGLATDMIGVAIETIANDATGRVCIGGYVAKINLAASANLGDTFGTHTVAKQGAAHSSMIGGDFGEVLGAGTAPAALLWGGMPKTTAGGGDVSGPASATDGHLAVFDGTTGKLVKDGGAAPSSALNDYICILDQKAQNTASGTFTSGAWRTRDLNTEQSDTGNHASVASNQITLAAGTYIAKISCPGWAVLAHKAKLYNVTDASDVLFGTSSYATLGSAAYGIDRSVISGKFTIATSKVFEVQHMCELTSTIEGFGPKTNYAVEIYTVAEFWKVA